MTGAKSNNTLVEREGAGVISSSCAKCVTFRAYQLLALHKQILRHTIGSANALGRAAHGALISLSVCAAYTYAANNGRVRQIRLQG